MLFLLVSVYMIGGTCTPMYMQAIVEGETMGVDGYIIDLRNNPGGVIRSQHHRARPCQRWMLPRHQSTTLMRFRIFLMSLNFIP